MVFPIAGGTQDTGYEISNSLRFNDGDSANLSRSISSSGSNTNASISFWLKRGTAFGSQQILFTNVKTDYYFRVALDSSARLEIIDVTNGSVSGKRVTNRLFRDPSAFYHIFIGVDGGQGTEENRVKVYINGVAETSWSSETAWQSTFQMNADDLTHYVGQRGDSNQYFDGYMSEFNYVDGTTKAYTDFGEFNDNGVWIPKKYTGSYGTNGFFLEFQQTGTSQNSSGIGADTSGQDNHFAVSNLAATDVTVDTPTNTFAVINSVWAGLSARVAPTLSEGNTQVDHGSTDSGAWSTIIPANGKWYAEFKITNTSSNTSGISVQNLTDGEANWRADTYQNAKGYQFFMNGNKGNNGTATTSYGSAWSDNDIIGTAMDLDNGKLYFSVNGTYVDSGDPTSGSSGTGAAFSIDAGDLHCIGSGYKHSMQGQWNFGNAPFSISSGNSDANGYGNFEYAVPSGYYSLNTKNLAEFG